MGEFQDSTIQTKIPSNLIFECSQTKNQLARGIIPPRSMFFFRLEAKGSGAGGGVFESNLLLLITTNLV